jgi:hypothetical protein
MSLNQRLENVVGIIDRQGRVHAVDELFHRLPCFRRPGAVDGAFKAANTLQFALDIARQSKFGVVISTILAFCRRGLWHLDRPSRGFGAR